MAAVNYLLPSGETWQDPADGKTYLLPSGSTIAASAAAGGLGLPIAMYHHTHHNLGTR